IDVVVGDAVADQIALCVSDDLAIHRFRHLITTHYHLSYPFEPSPSGPSFDFERRSLARGGSSALLGFYTLAEPLQALLSPLRPGDDLFDIHQVARQVEFLAYLRNERLNLGPDNEHLAARFQEQLPIHRAVFDK